MTTTVFFKLNKLMTYRLIMRYTPDEQDNMLSAWDDIEYPLDPLEMINFKKHRVTTEAA